MGRIYNFAGEHFQDLMPLAALLDKRRVNNFTTM